MKLLGLMILAIGVGTSWYFYPSNMMFVGMVVAALGGIIFLFQLLSGNNNNPPSINFES